MFFMFACRPLMSYCNNLCKYSSEYGLMVRICTEQSLYVDGSVISYKVSLDGIKSSVDLRMSSLPYTLWDSCKLSHISSIGSYQRRCTGPYLRWFGLCDA